MPQPFDLVGWIAARLLDTDVQFDLTVTPKVDDGLLHPSSHLGCEISMCHSRDPEITDKPKDFASLMRLMTGTLWHSMMEGWWRSGPFEGLEARCEVSMRDGMPKGWNGTADLLLGYLGGSDKHQPKGEWDLFDYKTIAPNAMRYLDLSKPKEEHQWQVSSYWWSAKRMGYKMARPKVGMLHIPLAPAPWGVKMEAIPMLQWIDVLPEEVVFKEMRRRSRVLSAYLQDKKGTLHPSNEHYLPKEMAKVSESKLNKKTGFIEEIEKPHWLTRYCDSPNCVCVNQTTEVVAYHNDTQPEVL